MDAIDIIELNINGYKAWYRLDMRSRDIGLGMSFEL